MASPGNRHCANCIGTFSFLQKFSANLKRLRTLTFWRWWWVAGRISHVHRAPTAAETVRWLRLGDVIVAR